jgi:hypothetical protein
MEKILHHGAKWLGLGLLGWACGAFAATAQPLPVASSTPSATYSLSASLPLIATGGFSDRREQAELLAASGHPRASAILSALLAGNLLAQENQRGELEVLIVGDTTTLAENDTAIKQLENARVIPINNPLRNALQDLIAIADIHHDLPLQRLLQASGCW